MVFRALAASIAVFGALASAVPVAQGTAREAFHQWGSQISAAPVPARWGQVQELEQVLAVQGVPVEYRDNCPAGLEGLYDPRLNKVLMCTNTMPDRSANYWNTLAHESVHVMQVCRNASPLSSGLKGIQREMLEATPQQEKMYILSAYPPEQRLFELEARWVANNFDPPAVINLLKDSCMAAANRPATHHLLPALLSKANL
ncbi:MAG: hypothetical protein VYB57_01080 [Cyanobacteriota bacterium]|jgi:hypothetical protein|nr:hypothetical protein [Cyanobacteriota bacterium]MEE2695663.1 hypothetical protein [Cyanobacteriota bacterium]